MLVEMNTVKYTKYLPNFCLLLVEKFCFVLFYAQSNIDLIFYKRMYIHPGFELTKCQKGNMGIIKTRVNTTCSLGVDNSIKYCDEFQELEPRLTPCCAEQTEW